VVVVLPWVHLGPPDHRDPVIARGADLGVVGPDRGRPDDDVGADHVVARVAGHDPHAQALEPLGDVGAAQVAAGHLVAQVVQDLGDAGHADAADADEVDASRA
jgi:hypothetical protein